MLQDCIDEIAGWSCTSVEHFCALRLVSSDWGRAARAVLWEVLRPPQSCIPWPQPVCQALGVSVAAGREKDAASVSFEALAELASGPASACDASALPVLAGRCGVCRPRTERSTAVVCLHRLFSGPPVSVVDHFARNMPHQAERLVLCGLLMPLAADAGNTIEFHVPLYLLVPSPVQRSAPDSAMTSQMPLSVCDALERDVLQLIGDSDTASSGVNGTLVHDPKRSVAAAFTLHRLAIDAQVLVSMSDEVFSHAVPPAVAVGVTDLVSRDLGHAVDRMRDNRSVRDRLQHLALPVVCGSASVALDDFPHLVSLQGGVGMDVTVPADIMGSPPLRRFDVYGVKMSEALLRCLLHPQVARNLESLTLVPNSNAFEWWDEAIATVAALRTDPQRESRGLLPALTELSVCARVVDLSLHAEASSLERLTVANFSMDGYKFCDPLPSSLRHLDLPYTSEAQPELERDGGLPSNLESLSVPARLWVGGVGGIAPLSRQSASLPRLKHLEVQYDALANEGGAPLPSSVEVVRMPTAMLALPNDGHTATEATRSSLQMLWLEQCDAEERTSCETTATAMLHRVAACHTNQLRVLHLEHVLQHADLERVVPSFRFIQSISVAVALGGHCGAETGPASLSFLALLPMLVHAEVLFATRDVHVEFTLADIVAVMAQPAFSRHCEVLLLSQGVLAKPVVSHADAPSVAALRTAAARLTTLGSLTAEAAASTVEFSLSAQQPGRWKTRPVNDCGTMLVCPLIAGAIDANSTGS